MISAPTVALIQVMSTHPLIVETRPDVRVYVEGDDAYVWVEGGRETPRGQFGKIVTAFGSESIAQGLRNSLASDDPRWSATRPNPFFPDESERAS